ncbi:MAG: DUF4416 family protein [Myxococcota bacterium]
MGDIKIPDKVCLIVSILYSDEKILYEALNALNSELCSGFLLDYIGRFDFTHYYDEEIGTPIFRRFWRAEKLFPRDSLSDIKNKTNDIEKRFIVNNKRRFNLDPGLLSAENFILATTKNYTHRIYLKDGIYADLTLIYKDKEFKPLEWTYPDYASIEIRELLRNERSKYLLKLRGS